MKTATPVLDREAPLPPPHSGGMGPALAAGFGTIALLLVVTCLQFGGVDKFVLWLVGAFGVWLPQPFSVVPIVQLCGWLIVVAFAPTVIHECGHLAAGMTAGFAFDGLRLGPLMIGRSFRVSRYRGAAFATSASAHVAPIKTDHFRARCLALVLGGPGVNLVCAAVLLAMPYAKGIGSAVFIFNSLAEGLSNLIPFQTNLVVSDGGRILMLLRDGAPGRRFMALLKLYGQGKRGALPDAFDSDDVAASIAVADHSPDTGVAHAIAWGAAYYQHDDDEAARRLDIALQHSSRMEPALRVTLMSDAGLFQGRRRRRADLAKRWLAELPEQLPAPWLRGRIETAILEAEGDVAGALLRLDAREQEVLALPDPAPRDLLVTATRRWKAELTRQPAVPQPVRAGA